MHIYIHTRNLSPAFNPSRLAPVEHAHAHAQGHTLGEIPYTGAVGSQLQRLMTEAGGSHLKHSGSRLAIFTVMIDDRVSSRSKLFRVLVLFSPTTEKTRSASEFEWGSTKTNLAIRDILSNLLIPLNNVDRKLNYSQVCLCSIKLIMSMGIPMSSE